ncbi:hypothetical protein [Vibrio sp. THAF190c]|uniref:hypothetical protein n=1 Tax=Vibrio sp. THAF190c TaxID=2587865 RepID=UPI0012689B33|nr:hypothetical protein [Vibrio sp. THAF190c]QFT12857.1 hypothetical protein FIV04_23240 [Vibrio sp. THAF190c]
MKDLPWMTVLISMLLGFTSVQSNAAEFQVDDTNSTVSMNYHPASTIKSCLDSSNCTSLSFNSRAIDNLLAGREVKSDMDDNKNISAQALRGGQLYSTSEKATSFFNAKLISHNPVDRKIAISYSISLTASENKRSFWEYNKTASLSGNNYTKFIETKLSVLDIPNKVLLNQFEIFEIEKCSKSDKYCFSELAYYPDYNLYLLTSSMNLTEEQLKGSPAEQVLEGILKTFLPVFNPLAAKFYDVPPTYENDKNPSDYSLDSIILGIDAVVDDKQYVGYAGVEQKEHLSLFHSVEETNNSVVQLITRLCNKFRKGNHPKNLVDEHCDYSGSR